MTKEEAIQLQSEPFDEQRKNLYLTAYQVLYGYPYKKNDSCGCDQTSDIYNHLVVYVQKLNEKK